MDLHSVIPCLFAPLCCLDEFVHDSVDLICRHGAGHRPSGRGRHVAGTEGLPAAESGIGGIASMVQLGEHQTVMAMDRFCELLQSGDLEVAGRHELVIGDDAVHIIHAHILCDDGSHASFGPLFIVTDHPGGGGAVVVGKAGAHGRHDAPIFHCQSSYLARCEQARETHDILLPF